MTRRIQLNRGFVARVSDRDYARLVDKTWTADVRVYKDGYEKIYAFTWARLPTGRRRKLYMHRAVTEAPAGLLVDHRDGDGLHNVRENLLVTGPHHNNHNTKVTSVTGFRGVTQEGLLRYRARINFQGEQTNLGNFSTAAEAARAYDKAAYQIYGEFAAFNFPDEWRSAEPPAIADEPIPF